jgi:hypothetical protein
MKPHKSPVYRAFVLQIEAYAIRFIVVTPHG